MKVIVPRWTAPALFGLLIGSTALAQGGGFVFDEPEPPKPEPKIKAAPETPEDTGAGDNDLADFTFGGTPSKPDAAPASEAERALWNDAETRGAPDGYRAYLEAYPEGSFAGDARAALAELQAAADRRQGLVTACDRMAGDPADPGLSDGEAGQPLDSIDADAALWTCSRALAAAPDLPRLSYNMGRISEAQEQARAALRSYRAALQQAIEQTGSPYLPAAAGILRLSEPRNSAERMTHTLLQLAIDGAARVSALQARGAELDEALALATAKAAEAEAEVAALKASVETLTAREMELSTALSDAEADGSRAATLAGEVAGLTAETERLTAELQGAQAEAAEAAANATRLRGLLTAADSAAAEAMAEVAALKARAADLTATLATLVAERDASAERAAAAEEKLAASDAKLKTALENVNNATSDVEKLQAEIDRLSTENAALRAGNVGDNAD